MDSNFPAIHFPAVLHYLLPAKEASKRIDANIRVRGKTICPFASARTITKVLPKQNRGKPVKTVSEPMKKEGKQCYIGRRTYKLTGSRLKFQGKPVPRDDETALNLEP